MDRIKILILLILLIFLLIYIYYISHSLNYNKIKVCVAIPSTSNKRDWFKIEESYLLSVNAALTIRLYYSYDFIGIVLILRKS